jgi:hypothetical protein
VRRLAAHSPILRPHLQPAAQGKGIGSSTKESDGKCVATAALHPCATHSSQPTSHRQALLTPDTAPHRLSGKGGYSHRGALPTGFQRSLLVALPPKKEAMVLAGR